ncbi:hypothetical protein BU15DRAFT_43035 [Melanogaster broomeanus]|nr:hypothetical protein BU15DRAFT_43035 [Melanogaster broomeanus]
MFAALFSIALFVTLFQTVFADFTIDTPTFVQCQESQITWTQSTPPYDILIVNADDVCGDAIEDLGNMTSLAVTWTVNLAAGSQVVLSLGDAAGNEAWSGTITVGDSNDSSCLAGTSAAPSAPLTTPTPVPSGAVASGGAATVASATPSAFAPAGAANAGLNPSSGAFSMRPVSAISVIGSAVVAAVAFAL